MIRLITLVAALTISLVPASATSAALVENIGLTLAPDLTYYNYTGTTGLFGFTSPITTGDVQSAATPVLGEYDYLILNATLTFSPVAMVSENSSGGIASADFAGGGTLTLTGDLKDKASGTTVYTGATLLVAEMVISSAQTWALQEQASFIMGAVFFNTVGGELYNGSLLDLGQFRLAFSAMPIPNPTSFAASHASLVTRIEMTAIPEPSTLAILGLGVLILGKRKALS